MKFVIMVIVSTPLLTLSACMPEIHVSTKTVCDEITNPPDAAGKIAKHFECVTQTTRSAE